MLNLQGYNWLVKIQEVGPASGQTIRTSHKNGPKSQLSPTEGRGPIPSSGVSYNKMDDVTNMSTIVGLQLL